MGTKYKFILIIVFMLFLGIAGFVGVGNKVEAGGCYTAHSYGAYPGSPCNWWSPWSAFIHSCQENNSYNDCSNWYYNGHYCYGDWYDISCDSSNCGDTVTCPVCGNTVTCPGCGSAKSCGESGCNDAPYPYCTSGNVCNSNVCQKICGSGYTRSGNCTCVPNSVPPKNCGESGCNNADYPYCTSGNVCNGNVCQIICGTGYSRSGNCSCVPDVVPPKNCGESGCTSPGCVSGNSCNSDVCQINCPSGYSRSGNCGCTPIPLTCGSAGCNTFGCTSGNSCNGNVCQINCPAGYSRSGDCACVPIPLVCGASGCNTFGCTSGNSCNSNVCQVNCPAGHSLVNNCNCLPPCSTLSASFSQSSCSLDISVSGASSYLTNLTFSGLPVTTITPNILYRHTITSAGTKSWTLNWQEVASVGTATPRSCSTAISYNIPEPSCGDVNMATVPNPLIWGNAARLNAAFTPPSAYGTTLQTYSLISSVHSNLSSCSGDAFLAPPDGENCTVSFMPDPKIYPWTVTWQTATKTCSAITKSCAKTVTFTATNKPSYLKTANGFSYFGKVGAVSAKNSQPFFNSSDNFSSNIFGSQDAVPSDHTLPCTGNAVNCTMRNYLLMGYTDKNSSSSWYTYFKNSLETNVALNLIPWSGTNSLSAVMSSPLVSSTEENVIEITGDFNASGLCTRANIFLINGNLYITPDLTISGANDACLFIVSGSTNILASSKVSATCGGATNPTTVASPQDRIQAFIITSNFTTNTTTNTTAVQLYIKGGVITNTFNSGLNRNVNTDTCLYPNLPSELMDYEGARYIKNLKDALSSATTISVFENQYKTNTQ